MLTDRQNRPILIFSLGAYAFLMGLMTLASCLRPIGGISGFFLICLIFLTLGAAVLGGMVWLADAPLIRKLHKGQTEPRDAVAAILYLIGFGAWTFGVIASWCVESAWSYAGFAFLSGVFAADQYLLHKREDHRPSDKRSFPPARLVK